MSTVVGFLAFPGFHILDLTGPLAAFDAACNFRSPTPYDIQVLSETGGTVVSSAGVAVQTVPYGQASPDTLVVVGGRGAVDADEVEALGGCVKFIQNASTTSRRIASVCSGTFILAAAGLLDGRTVTTHWRKATLLQEMYPKIQVDAERIFTQDGAIWTSAGVTAGIDLALALIEDDLGADVAREVAKDLVVYYRRPGGQSQFSALLSMDPPTDRIRAALAFAREHIAENLSVERLAEAAHLSPRQFARAFVAETGQTPAKAVEGLRAELARQKLQAGCESVDVIAQSVGFGDRERMRRAFMRKYGTCPLAVRRDTRAFVDRAGSQDWAPAYPA
ncbi:GlxA family transcriptional regulator [Bradyrhizobium manausense]|uniref:GlxA family transcriptional regulator n=1 Tax=Bradyrhizobium manausense TaxID=989370 RepID=UPI001BA956F9|nr:GlxA family transcriptional regulator [Bradyrhizobium manausense]MBR0687840.1 GlxA family transcriptional regulator [Bradyrhizobium manausense]